MLWRIISVFTLTSVVTKSLPFDLGVHTCADQWSKGISKAAGGYALPRSSTNRVLRDRHQHVFHVNSPTSEDDGHAETSANNQVILLSCDFLFFPSLHRGFRGQEDLSTVTERIMGVGIPLAVITALRQHPVLSLPLLLSSSVFLSFLSLVLWQTKKQLVSH